MIDKMKVNALWLDWFENNSGKRVGSFTVGEQFPIRGNFYVYSVQCVCDCGVVQMVQVRVLRYGTAKGCRSCAQPKKRKNGKS